MTLAASVVTTFPNHAWDTYAKPMLVSFTGYWPAEIALLVFLDDQTLVQQVAAILRPQDAVAVFNNKNRAAFLERNKGRDDANDYRKQASRFCHKVFALQEASDYWTKHHPGEGKCRYLIWLDADVITTRLVSLADIAPCLPRQGDAVSYLGRKDWPHSECGWLAFDLESDGASLISCFAMPYLVDSVFQMEQWHDSWVFDQTRISFPATNLTEGKPGMDIWPQSPMAAWSRHYKGPVAKNELAPQPVPQRQNQPIKILTKNSIPHETIRSQIAENQTIITQWIRPCLPTDEPIVVVSAGPRLIPEDLREEVTAGRRIVAVKHALQPLREAGVKPWACILLDPRPHLYAFVENPDTDILWLVASQVHPGVVRKLIDSGCNVWGYHAAVGAEETALTGLQPEAIVSGGSATATRGLFLLEKLGFTHFRLYGYELSLPDKPDMKALDEFQQPKHFELSVEAGGPGYMSKAAFWTKAELIAQFEEFNQIIQAKMNWSIKAFGHGLIPFVMRAKEVSDLRVAEKTGKINPGKIVSYKELFKCSRKTRLSALLRRLPLPILHKHLKESNF